MIKLQDELNEVNDNLANLVRYAIDYYKMLLKKYSKGRERKTEIRNFNTITAAVVAAANQKLYVDREGGFIGYSLKKDEYVMDCSDIDDIIVFRKDGSCVVTKIQDKVFVGKDIIYCSVFKKNDDRKVYNLVYFDAKSGTSYIKRFKITAVTRDRVYDLTAGNPKSKVLYFTANDNGEAEVIQINLTASCTARVKQFEYDFKDLLIKGRDSMGNVLTKYPVRKIVQKSAGVSTLGGLDIWYDPTIGRLNRDEHGKYLGNFEAKDHILVVYNDGQYELTNFELTNRYEPKDIAVLTKFVPESVISAVYYDGASKLYYVKRFRIETTTVDKKFLFISDEKGSKLYFASVDIYPRIELTFKKDEKGAQLEHEEIAIDEVAEIRGWKALGSKLSTHKVQGIKPLEPKIVEVSVPESNEEEDKTETEEAIAAKLVEPEEIEFPENSDSGTGEQLGLF
jgi:topoisomerase-4 subunit A